MKVPVGVEDDDLDGGRWGQIDDESFSFGVNEEDVDVALLFVRLSGLLSGPRIEAPAFVYFAVVAADS